MLYKISNEPALRIRDLRSDIPEALAHIVHRMMEKDLSKRYISWADLAGELAAYVMPLEKKSRIIADSDKFNALKKLSFFVGFSDVELWEVLRISEWARFPTGKILVKEGDSCTSFYILTDGEVYVNRMGEMLIALSQSDCFGEIAYIEKTKAQRSASVISAMPIT